MGVDPWKVSDGYGFDAVSGVANIASNLFGSLQQTSYSNAASAASNKYNSKLYDFQWNEALRNYSYQQNSVAIDRSNELAVRQWRNKTALRDYQHGMAIREYEYNMQMRAYNKSEETYKQQLNFNNMAAQVAMESEDRWLDERFKETAFANQDLFVQLLQEEGKASLTQPGRSAGKIVQSVLAQAGRNQAILVESLVSAQKQSSVNRKKISSDKYGADLQAFANRMLKPEIAPALPKPIPLPAAIFQDPLAPKKPPKPPSIQPQSNSSSWLSAGLGAAATVLPLIFSDQRLKENIEKVGQSESGINIYEFNYLNESQRYRGVIAQDIVSTHPEAVIVGEDGFYRVNYDLIDVNMQPV